MKKSFYFSILLSAVTCLSAAQPIISWQKAIGTTGTDYGQSVIETSDSGYVIAGYTNINTNYDVYLIKTNINGDTLWKKTYGGSGDDRGYSVYEMPDKGLLITGYSTSYGAGSKDIYIIKTDANGVPVFSNKVIFGSGEDWGYSIRYTLDDRYAVAGFYTATSPGLALRNLYLAKLSTTGNPIWAKQYGGMQNDEGYWVHQDAADSNYIVTGYTSSMGAGLKDVYIVKTNPNGDSLWTRSYGGTQDDEGWCVKNTKDGGHIVAGYTKSFGKGGMDFWVLKLKSNGDTAWTRTYGGTGDDRAYAITVMADSGYVIAGTTKSFGAGATDAYLIRINDNGDTVWTKTAGGLYDDEVFGMQYTKDNGYIAAGRTLNFGQPGTANNFYLVKFYYLSVGMEETVKNNRSGMYPNPFASETFIRTSSPVIPGKVIIYDMLGNNVTNQFVIEQAGGEISIRRGPAPDGVYIYRAEDADGKSYSGKMVLSDNHR